MQLLANGKQQFIDSSGAPLASGKVYFYQPATLTPATTYQDAAGTIPNTNPVSLDSLGQGVIWGAGTYRQIVKDAGGSQIWDQIVSSPDLSAPLVALSAPSGAALVGLTLAPAGSVVRTVQDKLRESVSVKDFGAKGDGSTDDTAAIQTAINSGALSIYFPAGTYITSAVINLRSNLTLFGNRSAIVKLKPNCSPKPYSMFATPSYNMSSIVLDGLVIDGNGVNNVDHGTPNGAGNQNNYWTGTLLALVNITQAFDVVIRNCVLRNSWGSGVWLTDCYNVHVQDNYVYANRMSGIALRHDTSFTSLSSLYAVVSGNFVSDGVNGIHNLFGTLYTTIDNNIVTNCRDQNRFPSYAYSGTYPNVWPTTGGFTASGGAGYVSPAFVGDGAGIESTGKYTDPAALSNFALTISNNILRQNQVGVRLEEQSTYAAVTGNQCFGNYYHGILVFSSNNINMTGNVCAYNLQNGIAVQMLSGKDAPFGNLIVGNEVNNNAWWGIYLAGTNSTHVRSNYVNNNNSANFALQGAIALDSIGTTPCIFTTITGNTLQGGTNDNYGVWVNTTTPPTNTIVRSNDFAGFVVAKTNALTTAGNIINGNLNLRSAAYGQATVLSTGTSVTVTHGLYETPVAGQIVITPTADVGTARYWVSNITSTTFQINHSSAQASNVSYHWACLDQQY